MQGKWRFAELARGESLQSPDTCAHCGRQELKKTIKLVHIESGTVAWLGTGCAAKAMGVGLKEARQARKDQETARELNAAADRKAAHDVEMARYQTFLDETAGIINAWDGKRDKFKQIEKLGGWKAAHVLYDTWKAARV